MTNKRPPEETSSNSTNPFEPLLNPTDILDRLAASNLEWPVTVHQETRSKPNLKQSKPDPIKTVMFCRKELKRIGWWGESFNTVRPHLKLTDDDIRLLSSGKRRLRWNFDVSRFINLIDFLRELPYQRSRITPKDLKLPEVVAAHSQAVLPEVISCVCLPGFDVIRSF